MILSSSDRADLGATLTDLLWADATATVTDADGTNARTVSVALTNATALRSRRDASDLTAAYLPLGSAISPANLLEDGGVWYLVAKVSVFSALVAEHLQAVLLRLPVLLSVQHVTRPDTLSIYEEPLTTDSQGRGILATTTVTLRAGLSNSRDPLTVQAEGTLPSGNDTAYVPLGAPVVNGDQVTIDGRPFVVQQTNTLYSDGGAYGQQLILDQTTSAGYAP